MLSEVKCSKIMQDEDGVKGWKKGRKGGSKLTVLFGVVNLLTVVCIAK